ncbi:MAG TPA: hypothetical protein VNO32_01020, partial [Candidatus Acidoferrum sp.]|nr:hypothetical protein [Candidatus Acidoferrum sp.]
LWYVKLNHLCHDSLLNVWVSGGDCNHFSNSDRPTKTRRQLQPLGITQWMFAQSALQKRAIPPRSVAPEPPTANYVRAIDGPN